MLLLGFDIYILNKNLIVNVPKEEQTLNQVEDIIDKELNIGNVVDHSENGIVLVLNSTTEKYSDTTIQGIGTGFFYRENIIVTNAHVIYGAKKVYIAMRNDEYSSDRYYLATVKYIDEVADIAFLEINDYQKFKKENDYNILKVAPDFTTRVSDDIYSIGHPWGLMYSVSKGIVSNIYRKTTSIPIFYYQIDSHVFEGNSGGPTINMNGEVICVNSIMVAKNGGSFGLCIPIEYVNKIYSDHLLYNETRWVYLGIKIDHNKIVYIIADSPAYQYGLKENDIILGVKTKKGDILKFENSNELLNLIWTNNYTDQIEFEIQRHHDLPVYDLPSNENLTIIIYPEYKYSKDYN